MGLHIKSLVIILTIASCYCQRIKDEKETKNIVIVYSKGIRSYNAPKPAGTVVVPEPRYDTNVFIVYPQSPKAQTEKYIFDNENQDTTKIIIANKEASKPISIEISTQLPDDMTTLQNDESVTSHESLHELLNKEHNTESYYKTTELIDDPSSDKELFTTENNLDSTTIMPEPNNETEKVLTLKAPKPLTEPLLQSATKRIETVSKLEQDRIEVLPSQFEPVIGNDELNIESVRNNELDSMFQGSSIISRDPNRRRRIFNRRISSSTYYTPTFSVTPKPSTTLASKISNRNQVNVTENHFKNNKRATVIRNPLNSMNFVNRLIDRSKKTRISKSKRISLKTSNNASLSKNINAEQRTLQRTFIIRKFNKQKKSLIATTTPKVNLTIPNDKELDFAEDMSTEWKSMKIHNIMKRIPYRGRNKFLVDRSHSTNP